MRKTSEKNRGKTADTYLKLILRFPLRSLRTDADLQQAIDVMNELLDRPQRDEGEDDYLDVLSDLVEKYEREHHPIAPAGDGAMVRFLLDLRELSQVGLARQTGIAESTISAVISGRRQLSRRHIGILAGFFQVEPAVFLSESTSRSLSPAKRDNRQIVILLAAERMLLDGGDESFAHGPGRHRPFAQGQRTPPIMNSLSSLFFASVTPSVKSSTVSPGSSVIEHDS